MITIYFDNLENLASKFIRRQKNKNYVLSSVISTYLPQALKSMHRRWKGGDQLIPSSSIILLEIFLLTILANWIEIKLHSMQL